MYMYTCMYMYIHVNVLHCMCVPASCKNSVNLISLWWFAEDPSEGWRCPACQNGSTVIPTLYRCYCGKITNPRPRSRGDLTAPHSCGDLCSQNLAKTPQSSCQHKCQLLCHPGTVYESKKHQHFYPSYPYPTLPYLTFTLYMYTLRKIYIRCKRRVG